MIFSYFSEHLHLIGLAIPDDRARFSSRSYAHAHTIGLPRVDRLARLLDFLQHRLVADAVFCRDVCGLRV
jgi:hypothetical protein